VGLRLVRVPLPFRPRHRPGWQQGVGASGGKAGKRGKGATAHTTRQIGTAERGGTWDVSGLAFLSRGGRARLQTPLGRAQKRTTRLGRNAGTAGFSPFGKKARGTPSDRPRKASGTRGRAFPVRLFATVGRLAFRRSVPSRVFAKLPVLQHPPVCGLAEGKAAQEAGVGPWCGCCGWAVCRAWSWRRLVCWAVYPQPIVFACCYPSLLLSLGPLFLMAEGRAA
jgi:hypothetical protein